MFSGISYFFNDPADVANLISGSSAFSKSSLNIWKFMVHILLKPGLESFGKERKVPQSCLTLCDPMDCSLPGFSVHGIFQARVLEWVAISFSRGSSQPRDRIGSPTLEADALPTEPPNLINLLEQLVSSSI